MNYDQAMRKMGKRAKPWKDAYTSADTARVARLLKERIFIIARGWVSELERTYTVQGSKAAQYTVTIGETPKCTCADAAFGHRCKHILFVMLRELRVPHEGKLAIQPIITRMELLWIFDRKYHKTRDEVLCTMREAHAQGRVIGWPSLLFAFIGCLRGSDAPPAAGFPALHASVPRWLVAVLNKRAQTLWGFEWPAAYTRLAPASAALVPRRPLDRDACPICCEDLVEGPDLLWCRASCGNSVHRVCHDRWTAAHLKRHNSLDTLACVYCRARWVPPPLPSVTAATAKRRRLEDKAHSDHLAAHLLVAPKPAPAPKPRSKSVPKPKPAPKPAPKPKPKPKKN